jgi:HlyD family secretion protein
VKASQWRAGGITFAIALALLGLFFRDAIFGVPVAVREVTRSDIVRTVVASGRVVNPQRVSIAALVTETVARVPVQEGQSVRRGDVLVELDDRDERAAIAQAEAAVAQAEAKVRQLREAVLSAARLALGQAEANHRLARTQFERYRDLKAKGYISQAALDDATRNLDVAASQLDAARVAVRTHAPGGADYEMAQSALVAAQAGLDIARTRLAQTVVAAPADGVLIARNVERGDVVQPGKALMVLAPNGETQVVVDIDEKHLAELKRGQLALVSADAYPNGRFEAELFYINPGIDAVRGSVEVKLRVREPPDYLRQDMTVSVDIEVAARKAALVAPADCVFDAASGHPWVLALVDGRAVRKDVMLGIRGGGQVEITSGAQDGDRLVPVTAGVAPGRRIRVVTAAS